MYAAQAEDDGNEADGRLWQQIKKPQKATPTYKPGFGKVGGHLTTLGFSVQC